MDASDWIPCSRKLPDLEERVYCWMYDDYYIGKLKTCDEGLYWYFDEFDYVVNDFDDVVAWMPLPDDVTVAPDEYKAE